MPKRITINFKLRVVARKKGEARKLAAVNPNAEEMPFLELVMDALQDFTRLRSARQRAEATVAGAIRK